MKLLAGSMAWMDISFDFGSFVSFHCVDHATYLPNPGDEWLIYPFFGDYDDNAINGRRVI